MSYVRVIPRDLFNEGNLLKCYGQLYLNLEKMRMEDCLECDGNAFDIWQNSATGGLRIGNVTLIVNRRVIVLERPMNSREPYPLWALPDDDEIKVFNADGSFTEGFVGLLRTRECN